MHLLAVTAHGVEASAFAVTIKELRENEKGREQLRIGKADARAQARAWDDDRQQGRILPC